MKDLIIIGGGPGAMSAGVYAARMKLDITLVTKSFDGQITKTDKIENYLGFQSITGLGLNKNFEEHLRSYDIEIIEDNFVKRVYEKDDLVFSELDDGKILKSKTAIIAVGCKRKKLGVSGDREFENKGVTYCAVCDGPVFHNQDVAVVGGSYSGTKTALYLSKIAKKVYIIEIDDELKGEKILIDEIKKTRNIQTITNAKITEIYGNDFVEGLKYIDLKTDKSKDIKIEGISIEIGVIPNSNIVNVKKNKEGEIKVDENMRTSSKRIFAVGDANDKGPKQVIVAAAQGCIAALRISEDLK